MNDSKTTRAKDVNLLYLQIIVNTALGSYEVSFLFALEDAVLLLVGSWSLVVIGRMEDRRRT